MRAEVPPPGPPPGPPADLNGRTLPLDTVPPGTLLYRIHRSKHDALYFGPRPAAKDRGRWDAPDDGFGVCCLAEAPHLAFAEALLRDLDLGYVGRSPVAARSLTRVEVIRNLELVALHGHGLRRVRATAAVVQAAYPTTWAWSAALHGHPSDPAGLRYRARHDDDAFGVALYDRAAGLLVAQTAVPLLDSSLRRDVADWLDRYGVGLGP